MRCEARARSLRGRAAARGREHALAVDLDHARAAVAVGPQAVAVAQVRQIDAVARGAGEDRFAGHGLDRAAVEREAHGLRAGLGRGGRWGRGQGRGAHRGATSSGKKRSTESKGFGAA
jgi:hypothetical protein